MVDLEDVAAALPQLNWYSSKWSCEVTLSNGHEIKVITDYRSALKIQWNSSKVMEYWGDALYNDGSAAMTVATILNQRFQKGKKRIDDIFQLGVQLLAALKAKETDLANLHIYCLSKELLELESCDVWKPYLKMVKEYMEERGWEL